MKLLPLTTTSSPSPAQTFQTTVEPSVVQLKTTEGALGNILLI